MTIAIPVVADDIATLQVNKTTGEVRIWDRAGFRKCRFWEAIEVEGGNHIMLNGESYWTGAIHGGAVMALVAMAMIGVIAALVVHATCGYVPS